MTRYLFSLLVVLHVSLWAQSLSSLTLEQAIQRVKKTNLEINIARYNEEIKALEHHVATGSNYGSLDLKQLAIRSNDAGNIFGFKLQSREASFADFGFADFLKYQPSLGDSVVSVQPQDLNYPKARNNFQTQLEYTIPLYTGGKLEQYGRITKALEHLSTLEREQLTSQKVYEVKKSFFSISLLDAFISNLTITKSNIEKLELMTKEMMKEGYAKKVDLLEVEARRFDINRLLNQATANRALAYHFLSFLLDERVISISGVYEDALHVNQNMENILEQNLDIQKAHKGLEISQMNIALQESAFLPTVGAFVNYGSSDNQPFNDFAKHDAYTVGLQLKWNLFNGGVDKNNVEKARVENLKAVGQLSLAQKGIALHVEEIKTQIQSYEFEIESLKKEVELSRAIYENYFARYGEKLVSINDVIIKQSEEIAKVLRLKEIQNSRNEKIFELEKIAHKEAI
ncbi:MAG: TolC family protein [Campylobacteraceae bacterium]|nr:TolC family protein [Campylobacteraceae bacterium]